MRKRNVKKILVTDALVRYNDDIRGLFEHLKQKVRSAIECFKAWPLGRKIAYCLGRIVQIVGAIITGRQAIHAVSAAKEIRRLYEEANESVKKVAASGLATPEDVKSEVINPAEVEIDMPIKHRNPFAKKVPFSKKDPFAKISSTSKEYEYDRSKSSTLKGTFMNMLKSTPAFYMSIMKAIGGLVMAISGTILATYAKA